MFIKSKYFCLIFILAITINITKASWEIPEESAGTKGEIGKIFSLSGKLFSCSNSNGVYISVNNGLQWLERNSGITNLTVKSITNDGTNIYAATEGSGIFKTSNQGDKWDVKNNGLGNNSVYAMTYANNNVYAVTDESGIYYSSDKGGTWNSMNNGDIIGMILYTITVDGNNVYVGAQDGHIYKTNDNGTNWLDIKNNPLVFSVKSIGISGNKIFAGTSKGVFLTTDNGGTWVERNTGLKNQDITDIKFNNNLTYVSTRGGGIYISNNDGLVWFDINDNLPDINATAITFDNQYIYAGSQNASVCRRLLSEIAIPVVKAPILLSPTQNQENVNETTPLAWEETIGSASYHVQISLSTDFSVPFNEKDGLKSTLFNANLQKGTTYYWRVATNTGDNQKLWSEVWKFKTREELTSANLVYPPNNAKKVGTEINFKWNKASGAVSYTFQLASDTGFYSVKINQTGIVDDHYTNDKGKLIEDTTYYWRIVSVSADDSKKVSETWQFLAGGPNNVFEIINNTDNNYLTLLPNPVSDLLKIQFNRDMNITKMEIVGLNGNVYFENNPGMFTIGNQLDLSNNIKNLTNGKYFIRLILSEKVLIVPFVIAK